MNKLVRSIYDYIARRVVIVAAVLVLAVIADLITPLKQLDAYFKEYPQLYTSITLGMLVVGFVLLWYPWSIAIFGRGEPARARWQGSIRRGKTIGREARMTASFREVKTAFRTGDWLLNSQWRPICVGLIGALLALIGMFGYLIVIGPPTVKLITGVVLIYALAQIVWGFWRA